MDPSTKEADKELNTFREKMYDKTSAFQPSSWLYTMAHQCTECYYVACIFQDVKQWKMKRELIKGDGKDDLIFDKWINISDKEIDKVLGLEFGMVLKTK